MINLEDLFPEDQYLLSVNLEELASTPADKRQVWQANLETAIAVAEPVSRKQDLPKTMNTRSHTSNQRPTNN